MSPCEAETVSFGVEPGRHAMHLRDRRRRTPRRPWECARGGRCSPQPGPGCAPAPPPAQPTAPCRLPGHPRLALQPTLVLSAPLSAYDQPERLTRDRHSGDATSGMLHLCQLGGQPGALLGQDLVVNPQLHKVFQQLPVISGRACDGASWSRPCLVVMHPLRIPDLAFSSFL